MIFDSGSILIAIIFLINTTGIIRYFFQWGDPASSPGYELVPGEFFIYWNFLTIIVVMIILVNVRKVNTYFLCGYLMVSFFACLVVMSSESFYVLGTARSLILNGLLFLGLSENAKFISIRVINKCIEFLGVLTIGFLLLQIVRVYAYDIYPTHSHPEYLVRYGGIYDDSLVLAIMAPMFAGYFLRRFQSIYFLLLTCLLSICVALLTGSFTGMLITIAYTFWCSRENLRLLVWLLFSLIALAIWQFEYFFEIFQFKQDSISAHAAGWHDLFKVTPASMLGIVPADIYPEPGYLSLLLNFGLPIFLGFLGLLIYLLSMCIYSLKSTYRNRELRSLVGATEGLLISVALANFNFPVVIFPPVYLMLAILAGLAHYYIQTESTPELQGSLSMLDSAQAQNSE